jgi:hypothetical protein
MTAFLIQTGSVWPNTLWDARQGLARAVIFHSRAGYIALTNAGAPDAPIKQTENIYEQPVGPRYAPKLISEPFALNSLSQSINSSSRPEEEGEKKNQCRKEKNEYTS